MDSSDEEGEITPDCVTNYYFINDKDEPISFTVLPLQWSENESLGDVETHIYLRGSEDDGLRGVYKRVIAWRFDLSYVHPEISVLSKEKKWLTLQNPRKSYQNIVRTILLTIHFLHFVKKNPEKSGNSLWTHLFRELSSFEVQHSEEDLLIHLPLIREAMKRDKDLAKSKYLFTYMENPTTNKAFKEKPEFINDDDCEDGGVGDDGSDELYDHVCAICDNGGDLLCCEGRCMRSFHATKEDGSDSLCESLGLSNDQVKALPIFMCQNCKHKQHQCFICGKLGSSDKTRGTEVFPCASATCGHFYHPDCVAQWLHPVHVDQAEELQKKIAAGESFTCPAHKCCICGKGENKEQHEKQFALCRRCPKTYHRKCLPRSISFEYNNDNQSMHRAWDGLLPSRILIYCMDHEIIRELGTPARNHFKFPLWKNKQQGSSLLASREKAVVLMKKKYSGFLSSKGTVIKLRKGIQEVGGGSINLGGSTKNVQKRCGPDSVSFRLKNAIQENRIPPKAFPHNPIFPRQKIASTIGNKSMEEKMVKVANSSQFSVDPEIENKIEKLMKEATSAIDRDKFMKSKKGLAKNANYDNYVEKSITTGKVEVSVEAIRTALSKLDAGGSIDDAKAICEPKVLSQVFKWKTQLKVYLAPFLHGRRYTSYGRHFTKVDKLKQIVDRLHWYMQDGDMLVDFCCGSNDFSCLMKEKLEQTGKNCKFKNYDILPAKNDFNFEQKDWMTVNQDELPNGSQLIMGLNPPFGVNAALANKFIRKAMEFRPKLLILIVPKETKRLDEKNGYNLIWEDEKILSGKSFYLPGSVDVHEKQLEDWNLKAPPLYLWSRCDWSNRHKAIATKHGHVWNNQEELHEKGNSTGNQELHEKDDVPIDYNEAEGAGTAVHDADDIIADMDLCTPTNSPAHSAFQNECSRTSKMELDGCQDVQRSQSRNAMPIELDQGIQTENPTCADNRPSFSSAKAHVQRSQSGNALPIELDQGIQTENPTFADSRPSISSAKALNYSWAHNFTYQSHGCTTGTTNNFNQASYNNTMKENIHGLPMNHNLPCQPQFAPYMVHGFQHFGSSPPVPPPGIAHYQTTMIGGSGNLTPVHPLNDYAPEPPPPGVSGYHHQTPMVGGSGNSASALPFLNHSALQNPSQPKSSTTWLNLTNLKI